jgi:sterol 14-demethylase
LAEVLNEQEEVLGGDAADVTAETLGRLERLEWALKETQRMHPVMSHYARYNAEAYEWQGYYMPKGWLTFVCPAVSHRLPEVFSHPDSYDPRRFAPERAEDQRQHYSLIGFGAGLYRCPGAAFGTNEMKCILSLLLQRFELELLDAAPRHDFEMGVIRPRPPCRVRYRRRVARRNVIPMRERAARGGAPRSCPARNAANG